jgi:TfoX/Sxy family transcriptional regulator of competence genes
MSYNEELAYRIRPHLEPFSEYIEEKKMFGGLSFMYKGKMSVGIVKDDLMVRVVADKFEKVLTEPYVQPMNFTGKAMKNFVQVLPGGLEQDSQLSRWVDLGIEHAESQQ